MNLFGLNSQHGSTKTEFKDLRDLKTKNFFLCRYSRSPKTLIFRKASAKLVMNLASFKSVKIL